MVKPAIEVLRTRALTILDAFAREEPRPTWARYREVVLGARRIVDLRAINQELRGAMAGLTPAARAALEHELATRFGPEDAHARLRRIVVKIRARGTIRSEGEYRAVQAYADGIAGRAAASDEFLALGALLDEYMSRTELPNER